MKYFCLSFLLLLFLLLPQEGTFAMAREDGTGIGQQDENSEQLLAPSGDKEPPFLSSIDNIDSNKCTFL